MQAGGARAVGSSGGGLRRGLLVVESALAVVLLVGAALFARSLVALLDVDAGYDPANVLVADVSISEHDGKTNRTERLLAAVLERVRGAPGVRAAGAGSMAPFGDFIYSWGFNLPGVAAAGGEPLVARALASIVTPGYVEALSIPLTDGRVFTTADTTSPVIAMLVNETFVRTYLNDGRPPVGRRFIGMLPNLLGRDDAVVHVVGVVDDVLLDSLDGQPQPQIYLPLGSVGVDLRRAATLVVKTDGDPEALVPLVTRTVQTIEPAAAVSRAEALTARVSASADEPRFFAFVIMAFGILALSLATAGLYGVLSYSYGQRRREFAVRAALGATRGGLVRIVLREGVAITAVGLVLGIGLAAVLARGMAGILFGVAPLDGVAFVAGPAVLLVMAVAACLAVGRRVTSFGVSETLAGE